MFSLDFMRYAYEAGTAVALLCGVMGVFVVARQLSFLTHTLSEIGFSGAAFGVWLGWSPLQGMLIFTLLSAGATSALGKQKQRRDAATSAISAFFMGLGVLFLSLSSKNASYATSILFGSIVGISQNNVQQIVIITVVVLLMLIFIYRRLSFDSFDPTGAQMSQATQRLIPFLFLMMMALSVSVAAQIVGSLLIFVLLTLPAASAQFLARSLGGLLVTSTGLALVGTWGGLYLAYITNWPVTFFIATIETFFYLITLFYHYWCQRRT